MRLYVAREPTCMTKHEGEYVSRRGERPNKPHGGGMVGVQHDGVTGDALTIGRHHGDGSRPDELHRGNRDPVTENDAMSSGG